MLSGAVVECKTLIPLLRTILFSLVYLLGMEPLTFIEQPCIVIGCLWIQQFRVHVMNPY